MVDYEKCRFRVEGITKSGLLADGLPAENIYDTEYCGVNPYSESLCLVDDFNEGLRIIDTSKPYKCYGQCLLGMAFPTSPS